MIEKNIEVLRKILYAVETGGQVYGKQRYDAFIGADAFILNQTVIGSGIAAFSKNSNLIFTVNKVNQIGTQILLTVFIPD